MTSNSRAFVLRYTRLQQVPSLPDLRLHLADDILTVWRAVQEQTRDDDAPIPYWAVAWGGGLAIALYLDEHAEMVRGKRVLDVASGSGLCAIAAARAGAAEVTAADIDPRAIAAIVLNAKANRQRLDARLDDLLQDDPPDVDVILAGDCWYEEAFAKRITDWLRHASDRAIHVLIGDPGRRHLDHEPLRELATYEVRSTSDLEDLGRSTATVYELVSSG